MPTNITAQKSEKNHVNGVQAYIFKLNAHARPKH